MHPVRRKYAPNRNSLVQSCSCHALPPCSRHTTASQPDTLQDFPTQQGSEPQSGQGIPSPPPQQGAGQEMSHWWDSCQQVPARGGFLALTGASWQLPYQLASPWLGRDSLATQEFTGSSPTSKTAASKPTAE